MTVKGVTIVEWETAPMHRLKFGGSVVASAGYDAQCELLEIEFTGDGQIWQYSEVAEEIWYQFKCEARPDYFFHNYIKGNYIEKQIL